MIEIHGIQAGIIDTNCIQKIVSKFPKICIIFDSVSLYINCGNQAIFEKISMECLNATAVKSEVQRSSMPEIDADKIRAFIESYPDAQ